MALPSRKQQIDAVAKFLDSDRNEGRSLEEIAAEIVDGYHEAIQSGVRYSALPVREGMLFKLAIDSKVRRVCWLRNGEAWFVSEDGHFGGFTSEISLMWEYAEEFRQSVMRETGEIGPNGKPKKKRFELSDEEVAEAWSNPDWRVGDRASRSQRRFTYEVIAVAPQCVLLQDVNNGAILSDSNRNLEKYYRRELKEAEW